MNTKPRISLIILLALLFPVFSQGQDVEVPAAETGASALETTVVESGPHSNGYIAPDAES